MAVKPSDGAGYTVEDDTFRDEEVQLVHVEPPVSGAMQPAERGGQTIRYRIGAFVEPRGKSDGNHGDNDAGAGYRPVQVDDVFHPVAADKLPERDEPGEKCYHGKEHEG